MAVNKTKRTNTRFVEQTDGIKRYWKDFRKAKPLDQKEEQELFTAYATAGKADRKRIESILSVCNQKLLYSTALDFTKDPDLIQDYIREGNIGLLTAARKFDKDKGVRFMTFAADYIYREMYEYHSKFGELVRRSNDKKIGKRIRAIKDEFYTKSPEHRDPTNDEIKEIFEKKYGIVINEDVDMLDVSMSSIDDTGIAGNSDAEVDQTEMGEFAVATASSNGYINQEEEEYTNHLVNALLSKLSERDREIVKLYYGIDMDYPMNLDDIAEKFRLTRTRINQILAEALKTMRQL